MQNNTFWKFIGDFWKHYRTPEIFERMWGPNIEKGQNLLLQSYQCDLAKSINTLPVYWKYKWFKFDFSGRNLEFDIKDNDNDFEFAFVYQGEGTPLDIEGIIPGSVRLRTLLNEPVGRDKFEVNFFVSTITSVDDGLTFGGEYVITGKTGEMHFGTQISLVNSQVAFHSESVFNFTREIKLNKRNDYVLDYKTGSLSIDSEYSRDTIVVSYKFLDTSHPFPYKFKTPFKFHVVKNLYTDPRKRFEYVLGKDYILEGDYLRFKEMPEGNCWSEEVEFDLDTVYKNFGVLTGFRENNSVEYYNKTLGLTYSLQHGTNIRNMTSGLHSALNIPIAMDDERVIEIDYKNKIIYTDKNTYNYPRNPVVLPGDDLKRFQPISDLVEVGDLHSDPKVFDELFVQDALFSDSNVWGDDGKFADSMFNQNTMLRMTGQFNTFFVRVNNIDEIGDQHSMNIINFFLNQTKDERTNYFILASWEREENYELDQIQFAETDEFGSETFFGGEIKCDLVHKNNLDVVRRNVEIEDHLDDPFKHVLYPGFNVKEFTVLVPEQIDYETLVREYNGYDNIDAKDGFIGSFVFEDGMNFSPLQYQIDQNDPTAVSDTWGRPIPYTFNHQIFKTECSGLININAVETDSTGGEAVSKAKRFCIKGPYEGKLYHLIIDHSTIKVYSTNQLSSAVSFSAYSSNSFLNSDESSERNLVKKSNRLIFSGYDYIIDTKKDQIKTQGPRLVNGMGLLIEFDYYLQKTEGPDITDDITIDESIDSEMTLNRQNLLVSSQDAWTKQRTEYTGRSITSGMHQKHLAALNDPDGVGPYKVYNLRVQPKEVEKCFPPEIIEDEPIDSAAPFRAKKTLVVDPDDCIPPGFDPKPLLELADEPRSLRVSPGYCIPADPITISRTARPSNLRVIPRDWWEDPIYEPQINDGYLQIPTINVVGGIVEPVDPLEYPEDFQKYKQDNNLNILIRLGSSNYKGNVGGEYPHKFQLPQKLSDLSFLRKNSIIYWGSNSNLGDDFFVDEDFIYFKLLPKYGFYAGWFALWNETTEEKYSVCHDRVVWEEYSE